MFRNSGLRFAALFSIAMSGASATAADFARLPQDWYVLPEDASTYAAESLDRPTAGGDTYSRSETAVADSVDHVFGVTAQTLEKSGNIIGRLDRPADAPQDWAPWHLSEILMDLGINIAGTAGLVTGIGETSVEIRWRQTKQALEKLGLDTKSQPVPEKEEKADLVLDDAMSKEQAHAGVDRIATAVMATGKIEPGGESDMRDGLKKVVDDLQDIMVDINAYNYSSWDISKFGIDVEISGSGKVSNGMTVGGAVRLRFEWKRSSYGPSIVRNSSDPLTSERQENLRKLLSGVARELDTVNKDLYASSGFDLTTLKVGIGAYLSAKFGVVKGKLAVTGFAFFTKSNRIANSNYASNSRPRIILDEEIPLIDSEPKAIHKTYAAQNNVRFEEVPGGDGADRVIYFMQRDKFQKGLHRAVKMGAFFAERASKKTGAQTENKRWVIDQIKPNFALSLEGAFKVLTIGGKVSLEMTYVRQSTN